MYFAMRIISFINYIYLPLVLVLAFSIKSDAQKKLMYPHSEIPKALFKNSNAIIREDITKFEVLHVGKGKTYMKYAITILNKKADHHAEVSVGYDKLNKIISLKGRSYDKSGKLITRLKNKDIKDYSSFDGFSIYSDNRIKYFDLRYPEYPYTIEYELVMEKDGLLSFPGWRPYSGFSISSQKSSFQVTVPDYYDFRYLELNINKTAKEEIDDGKKIVSWNFGSFEALQRESRMPYLKEILPMILTAPSDFEMEGYAGNMSDWASFGKWEKILNDDRDVLPEAYAQKINTLVEGKQSRTEKIKAIYEYLQSNTRYISIQLGIGGWQTFPATDVASNGYGDCKALSNYMKAMLKSVDIESYYTLVKAGSNTANINKDFSSNQFNHMILCVPNYQDTIWLECTSQDNPFGYLGSFTGDRDVLVINDEGGKIAHTKIYGQKENKQIQNTYVTLNENGSATASSSIVCTGLQYENYSGLLDISESEQKKWLFKNLDLTSFDLSNFKFDQKRQMIPEVSAVIDVSIHRFASVSGKRIFFKPNVFNKSNAISIPQKERKYDLVLRFPYEDIDTVQFQIPSGYHMEFIPKKISIDSPFGKYEIEIISEQGRITYIRKCSKLAGNYPPEEYINYVKFINKIAESDKMKLVLVKST